LYSKETRDEIAEMQKYLGSLSSEQRTVAMSVDLNYIDSVEELKTVLEEKEDFEAKVKLKADPQSIMSAASETRDNLQ